MSGERGREMRKRHSMGESRFNEIRGLYNRVYQGIRPSGDANPEEALRNDIAGDRRGTNRHKAISRKGGGQ